MKTWTRMAILLVACIISVRAHAQLESIRDVLPERQSAMAPGRAAAEAATTLRYDDGEADNGVRANPPHSVRVAMRFDAGSPGALTQVQFCVQRLFSAESSFGPVGVEVYSVGANGGPGVLLGSGTANVTGVSTTGIAGEFRTFVLTSAQPVPSSFFVGLSLDSLTSDFYACTDEDGAVRSVYGSADDGPWFDIRLLGFPDTKSLMVRATVDTGTTPPPPPPPPPGGCAEDGTTACLLNGRFRATVRFRNGFDGAPADTAANRKPVTGFANPNFETAFFFFNSPDNIEVMLKMLDQGNTNGAGQPTIAVLTGTATPLRVEVTITDTQTGASKTYTSPFGSQQGLTDFEAFVK